ncbi:MAG: hypothetical protein ABIB79_05390 [archaeon]
MEFAFGIKDIRLKENKIEEWVIKPKRKLSRKIRRKKLLLKHKDVTAIGEVMIVDKEVSKQLREL